MAISNLGTSERVQTEQSIRTRIFTSFFWGCPVGVHLLARNDSAACICMDVYMYVWINEWMNESNTASKWWPVLFGIIRAIHSIPHHAQPENMSKSCCECVNKGCRAENGSQRLKPHIRAIAIHGTTLLTQACVSECAFAPFCRPPHDSYASNLATQYPHWLVCKPLGHPRCHTISTSWEGPSWSNNAPKKNNHKKKITKKKKDKIILKN